MTEQEDPVWKKRQRKKIQGEKRKKKGKGTKGAREKNKRAMSGRRRRRSGRGGTQKRVERRERKGHLRRGEAPDDTTVPKKDWFLAERAGQETSTR